MGALKVAGLLGLEEGKCVAHLPRLIRIVSMASKFWLKILQKKDRERKVCSKLEDHNSVVIR